MHIRSFVAVFAFALLGVALVAACGGDDDDADGGSTAGGGGAAVSPTDSPSSSGASIADACALLTADDVAAVLGQPADDGVISGSSCQYSTTAAENFDFVDVQLLDTGTDENARFTYDADLEQAKIFDPAPEEIDGLGDAAYWDGEFGTMNVLKGQYQVDVLVSVEGSFVSDEARQAATSLAEAAANALP